MDEKITSRENAKIKYACRLSSSAAFRRSEGRFLAEGRKLCPELARGAQLETLFYTESAMAKCPELAGLPGEHYLVEDHVADKLADVGTHQGVFGVFRTPVHTLDEVKAGGRYLALERVQDPGNVGTLLRGIDKKEIERGQVLAKPGSIKPHTKFSGQVYVLSKDEGGRHTPFFNNYRPQFYFRTTDVTGVITLPEGTEMCMPGDNVEMSVELITPIAIEKGLRFAIREGGRTVGSGRVATVIE